MTTEHEELKKATEIVKDLAVTKDHAERGVALIQEFNKKLTRGDD